MRASQLIAFYLLCVAIVYFGNCIFAKRFIKPEPRMAILYVSTLTLIGVFGEIFINGLCRFFSGTALWEYRILPVHGGLSSKYAFFLWGVYGFHLYLLHGALEGRRINSKKYMTYIFGFEGVAIEFITNGLFYLIYKRYLFYYPATNLWHLTSIQAFPCYIAAGWVIVKSLARFKKDPSFFAVMNFLLAGVVVLA